MAEKFKCDQISATGAAVACDSVRDIKPFIFEPYLKSVLWGGDKIAAFKGIAVDRHDIGESWEISGVAGHESVVAAGADKGTPLHELIDRYRGDLVGKSVYERFGNTFPLLVKFIDAKRDLSLQVHPDDSGSATELRRGLTLLVPAVATSLCFTGKGSVITATM